MRGSPSNLHLARAPVFMLTKQRRSKTIMPYLSGNEKRVFPQRVHFCCAITTLCVTVSSFKTIFRKNVTYFVVT